MSTDKTLADVQPGGRVRLGHQAERARFEEFLSRNPLTALCAGTAWEVWKAALSAQPSQPSSLDLEAMLATCVPGGSIVDPQVVADHIRHWFSAQPSPGGQGALVTDAMVEAAHAAYWAHPDDSGEDRPCMRAALEAALAARQPVGEPVAWMDPDGSRVLTAKAKANASGAYKSATSGYTVPLYPPAQAVDLGAVRALLQRRIEQWRSHLPADPGAPGTREIETKGEHDYNNDVRIYREGIAVMEEVLSKIDSQAVGK